MKNDRKILAYCDESQRKINDSCYCEDEDVLVLKNTGGSLLH